MRDEPAKERMGEYGTGGMISSLPRNRCHWKDRGSRRGGRLGMPKEKMCIIVCL